MDKRIEEAAHKYWVNNFTIPLSAYGMAEKKLFLAGARFAIMLCAEIVSEHRKNNAYYRDESIIVEEKILKLLEDEKDKNDAERTGR